MTETIKISATLRTDFGKGYARRIRMAGDIPAVIYGHGEEPKHVVLPGHATTLAARVPNAILDLDIEGDSHLAMIKDIQRHPIRPELQHIDLLTVQRGERVELEIPVHIEGEAAAGTIANEEVTHLHVEADALNHPEALVANISGRAAGQHIHAADIELPAGVKLLSDADLIVVNIAEPALHAETAEASEEA
ncbi:MAG: 50S ribosomal protein L25/general stress protein Ctc [Rothia sp. (in: high G+C Gram-positive bacteria)]|nr:50S ribosomal protein L25/general stress protein Ctc [Rothia sp. (in: high G+C Gram-positive bacteria)]